MECTCALSLAELSGVPVLSGLPSETIAGLSLKSQEGWRPFLSSLRMSGVCVCLLAGPCPGARLLHLTFFAGQSWQLADTDLSVSCFQPRKDRGEFRKPKIHVLLLCRMLSVPRRDTDSPLWEFLYSWFLFLSHFELSCLLLGRWQDKSYTTAVIPFRPHSGM